MQVIGQKFTRLTVLSFIGTFKPYSKKYLCQCDCGNKVEVFLNNLRRRNTMSCGCIQKERASETITKRCTTHGDSKHPLYAVWKSMISRCYSKIDAGYKNYGGRGISVCDEWRNDFIKFKKYAIEIGWERGLSIDRYPNPNGNYESDNIRFVTKTISTRLRRGIKLTPLRANVIRILRKRTNLTNRHIASLYDIDESVVGMVIKNRAWL